MYIGTIHWGMSVTDEYPIKHVDVSDGSQIRHVGLRWVSVRSPMDLPFYYYFRDLVFAGIFLQIVCICAAFLFYFLHFQLE